MVPCRMAVLLLIAGVHVMGEDDSQVRTPTVHVCVPLLIVHAA